MYYRASSSSISGSISEIPCKAEIPPYFSGEYLEFLLIESNPDSILLLYANPLYFFAFKF